VGKVDLKHLMDDKHEREVKLLLMKSLVKQEVFVKKL
jgi:hypothetical protein